MNALKRIYQAIESAAPVITSVVAVLALIGVKLQIDSAERLQAEQSARDIYRGFLELSIAQPQFAQPDPCTGLSDAGDPGYDAYLDYLLYTTEQVTALDHAWHPVMQGWLRRHATQICTLKSLEGHSPDTPEVTHLIRELQAAECTRAPVCE